MFASLSLLPATYEKESVESQPHIGVMILAAGASIRMGQPKQLLLHEGRTLIRSAVETALASVCYPVVVVVGAHAELVINELNQLPVSVAMNWNWKDGMSSSIRIGLEALVATGAKLEGIVIMLGDQPFVTAGAVNRLVEAHRQTGKNIVASEYGEVRGVPALFSEELFTEIATLKANKGARRVIASHPDDVAAVCFPLGVVDVDTPQDYALLRKMTASQSADDSIHAPGLRNLKLN